MISDGTFDLMRERWFETIPVQYRNNGKDRESYHQHATFRVRLSRRRLRPKSSNASSRQSALGCI